MAGLASQRAPVRFRFVFWPSFIFNNMARFVFGFVFPQERVFNNFPASFLGSFGFVFGADSLLSITSRVRFSKNVFFCPTIVMPNFSTYCFQLIKDPLRVLADCFNLPFLPPCAAINKAIILGHRCQAKSARTFPIFLAGVAAGPQLARKFERHTRLASLLLRRSGARRFAENKAPPPGTNPRHMPTASLKSGGFSATVCRRCSCTFGKPYRPSFLHVGAMALKFWGNVLKSARWRWQELSTGFPALERRQGSRVVRGGVARVKVSPGGWRRKAAATSNMNFSPLVPQTSLDLLTSPACT